MVRKEFAKLLHMQWDKYLKKKKHTVLLVDASNAFNSLNKEAMLHNLQYLCPNIAIYVKNCYELFVAGWRVLESNKGTTQGDPLAMHAYGVKLLTIFIHH